MAGALVCTGGHAWNVSTLVGLREEVKEAFLHSNNHYIDLAVPFDELQPVTCQPRRYDNRTRGDLDDTLGGFMLTLIESLDALLLFREYGRFHDALKRLQHVTFARPLDVSVFETNIRVLGGLLSAHQLAVHLSSVETDADADEAAEGDERLQYDGTMLLDLAADVGRRLLPAFNTLSGIPVHRVNLAAGFNEHESAFTCTAAGTSFLLEMVRASFLPPLYCHTSSH
jgi:hypothetical protein